MQRATAWLGGFLRQSPTEARPTLDSSSSGCRCTSTPLGMSRRLLDEGRKGHADPGARRKSAGRLRSLRLPGAARAEPRGERPRFPEPGAAGARSLALSRLLPVLGEDPRRVPHPRWHAGGAASGGRRRPGASLLAAAHGLPQRAAAPGHRAPHPAHPSLPGAGGGRVPPPGTLPKLPAVGSAHRPCWRRRRGPGDRRARLPAIGAQLHECAGIRGHHGRHPRGDPPCD